jgi:Family of unknown function (DUF6788)
MNEISKIEARRKEILKEVGEMRSMRKGSVTEQFLRVPQKGKEPAMRGPYHTYTRKERGKTVGRRLKSKEVERFKGDVKAFHRFHALCQEYAELTERLGDIEGTIAEREEKKLRKSPSKKTRR